MTQSLSPESCPESPVLCIHPGLPKTASTFLETRVFRQLRDQGWSFNAPSVVDAARAIAYPDQNTGDPALSEAVRATGATRVLLSYDALCGDPYASFADRAAVLERLVRACDGLSVKVLLVVRRQAEWTESIFRQSLHEYYFTPFRKFVVWPEDRDRSGYPRLAVDALDWSAIASAFAAAFDRERVTVLPYELLAREPDAFIGCLSDFFDAPLEPPPADDVVNRGYGARSIRLALALNPLLREKSRFGFLPNRPFYYALKARRHHRIYGRLFRLSARLSLRALLQRTVDRYFWSPPRLFDTAQKERVMARCAEGNRRLADFCPVPLDDFGYFALGNSADAADRSQTQSAA